MTVKEHYDKHLGNFYSWMTGDFDQKQREHQEIFRNFNIHPAQNNFAIDLGCGHGIQSVALANLGFRVSAVDFNRQLLDELQHRKQGLEINLFESDLIEFLRKWETRAHVIVCMG